MNSWTEKKFWSLANKLQPLPIDGRGRLEGSNDFFKDGSGYPNIGRDDPTLWDVQKYA